MPICAICTKWETYLHAKVCKECFDKFQQSDKIISDAYTERSELLAYICKTHACSLEPATDCDDDPDFNWILYIDTLKGQVSWHISEKDIKLFSHVPRYFGRKWDGHTTEEKYKRLRECPL